MEIRGRYKLLHLLGEGKFGKVFKAIELNSTNIVAVKMECTNYGILKHETTILNYLNKKKCQNVPNVFWFGIESTIPCLILSFYPFSFMEYIRKNESSCSFKKGNERNVLNSMLKIIENIHSVFVIHRDIKPDNFMLNENYQLILIDFGLSLFIDNKDDDKLKKKDKIQNDCITGNLLFASPNIHEMYHSRRIDDVISIAYIGLFMCLQLTLPWIKKDTTTTATTTTINYLSLKGKDSLEFYRHENTNEVIDFILKLYDDKLLYVYK